MANVTAMLCPAPTPAAGTVTAVEVAAGDLIAVVPTVCTKPIAASASEAQSARRSASADVAARRPRSIVKRSVVLAAVMRLPSGIDPATAEAADRRPCTWAQGEGRGRRAGEKHE